MADRTLREILADIVDAGHRYPALHAQIFHCLFEGEQLRRGLFRYECGTAPHRAGDGMQVTVLVTKVWPTEWLLQLAHALGRGVVPEMVLAPADEFDGHEISHTREEHEATVPGDAFMRIPEYLNPE
ncbi:hypothetical protein LMG28688_01589 [Paraburkholderia caffeinitolerans]|uniref:Uncharacterized protein n=1 Tax=Paraburkholderia caffeinitolerans TaxID=1723730 RepID=A0A6J5FM34_9BURK|nr:hypothetical protein [Paraburkholderia caffeinitolerans]CAB3783150.1 hypothetical protein LMG28688_01589 [Paraburkholderia caffeinitolerans]